MRIALLSDVHANVEALLAVRHDLAGKAADRILCLGDIVGYNANPAECLEVLAEMGALCIAGNHDLAVTGRITTEGFTATASRAVAWTRAQLSPAQVAALAALPTELRLGDVLAVHGALRPDGTGCTTTRLADELAQRACLAALAASGGGARICAFGHTHHAALVILREGRLAVQETATASLAPGALHLVNPGSVGQPRTADRRAAYAVLDTARRTVALYRVPYDDAAAQRKTRAAGLAAGAGVPLPAPLRAALAQGLRATGLYEAARRTREAQLLRRIRGAAR